MKEKQLQTNEVNIAYQAYLDEARQLQQLQLKKTNIGLAISNINNALEYVFFSRNRLSIELHNEKYYLKSNGNDVLPKNVSIGERNIIALCYFFTQIMTNLEVSQFYKNETFVVIDDPVSSFDFENRVGILSYIRYQIDCVITGNQNSKVLIFTHDLTTAFDLRKAMDEIAESTKGDARIKTSAILQELSNNQLLPFTKERNEYQQLLRAIYQYANKNNTDDDMSVGNVMRRALEAFSTFTYKKSIEKVSCDKNVLSVLGDHSMYFNNLMYRLVLHGESHYEERVYSLRDNANFFQFISEDEKKRTAKDILCFIYLLNPSHIIAYFQNEPHAVHTIQQWCATIKTNSEFTLTQPVTAPKRTIRLYDYALSAGKGNEIDDDVSYQDYLTDEATCDFALHISGDSMEPGIPNGSVVLIKKCDSINYGEIGAFYYDGEVYCKRLLHIDGDTYLESINQKYSPIKVLPDNTLIVYGKVIKVDTNEQKS